MLAYVLQKCTPLLYCVSVVLCVELCEPPPDGQVVQVNRPILGSNVQV